MFMAEQYNYKWPAVNHWHFVVDVFYDTTNNNVGTIFDIDVGLQHW